MSATEDDNEDMYAIESVDQYVDLICELSPYRPVLEQVLGYLSARDLCRIPCVCKTWKSLLCETYAKSEANRRRVRHLKRVRKLRKSVGQVCKTHIHFPSISLANTTILSIVFE